MGREKDRKLRRRRRRKKKLRKFKNRLENATKLDERQYLVDKIRRISLNPKQDIPDEFQKYLPSR